MAIEIQQSSEEVKLCLSFVRRAELDSVRLVEAQAKRREPPEEALQSEKAFSFQIRFTPLRAECEGSVLRTMTAFRVEIFGEADPASKVIVIRCTFEGVYNLAPEYSPTKEEQNAFLKANGVFNCWPYFREFVQSSVTRMGFPAPPVPFLKLSPKPTTKKSTPTGSQNVPDLSRPTKQ